MVVLWVAVRSWVSILLVLLTIDGEERFGCFVLLSFCLDIVAWLFLAMQEVCLHFLIVVFTDHNHLLILVHVKKFNSFALYNVHMCH